ncbi:PREDICTED: L-type lectin-domain containing receptor kinase VIII.2 [Tarenaya hassleriana]|uniref:L-type lectin-domain containing receptor kinase VIII.2 n=1 Tax=Tarenaya hassleriana TaxID=28532 RepID=UPI00053C8E40|nr:PREDICTED: L-type lectin-domain containing receptor kinase VIII.2 [Tarenaya hassleriana]
MLNPPHKFVSVCTIIIRIASFLFLSAVRGDFPAEAPATKFDFATLTLSSLKLLGDAHLNNGSVRLTRDLSVPTSGAGRALYAKPIRFRRPGNHSSASFSTYFSFSITNLNPSSIGGGLAFVIAPDDDSIGSAGGYIGLTDGSGSGPGSGFVAVEFDTLMDVEFKDVNGNHVGLDLNGVVSAAVADLGNVDIVLKSGNAVNSWITYDGSGRILAVYVSYSNVKPKTPILSVPLDLDRYVNDFMFVGFSGSTQGSTEIHSIEWWSFSSSFDSDPGVSPPPISDSATSPPPSPAPSVSTVRRRSTSPPSSCRNQLCKKSPAAVAGVVTAGAFFLALFAGVLIWVYSKKIRYSRKDESFASAIIKTPREFSYKELKSATDCFSSARVIGHGAFGTVYRGVLRDSGDIVAVKKCSHTSQGNTEFLSELSIIGTLRHRNLLRLQGYCHEKGEILLVYDLMPNGSLDKALFDSPTQLPWPHRRKILLGVASALAYLHQECENQIIHRDIKTSNIMLDEGFNPKLGDFGLARQTEHDKSPDATAAAGTMGYLAPEYLLTGRATEKTDVFSYGAVVLEVSTGRRPIPRDNGSGFGSKSSLVDWVWGLHRDGKLLKAADERLHNSYDEVEMGRVLSLGLACSHPDPTARPTMRGVVQILIGEAEVPVIPTAKPSLSFSTSELLNTLQDSVSDCNEAMAPVSTSCSSSEHDSFIVGNDRSV